MSIHNIAPAPHLTIDDIHRFHRFVNKAPGQGPFGECWTWRGRPSKKGYGSFVAHRVDGEKQTYLAHRIAFYIDNRRWPEALVLHECDYPPCVRPLHLKDGSHAENMREKVERGRCYRGGTSLPGESNPNAKLDESRVRDIRKLFAFGFSKKRLAVYYGVSRNTITRIVTREYWSHC